GKGMKCHNVTEKTGFIAGIKIVSGDNDILMISDDGTIIRTGADTVSVLGRATQGVRLMRVGEGAKLISVTVTDKATAEDTAETGENGENE
ncbi:MAG: DNA gyrase subunit A, partial [Oscillospiraceae bacterium]|nr:DNA gyrase subunit A [Oscillospiraceae bacterium]